MSFIQDNFNFLRIKIHSELIGLSRKDQREKYNLIQNETRQRLQRSFENCNNRSDFYVEALQELKLFESEYLFMNIFFEEKCEVIINKLIDKDLFEFEQLDSELPLLTNFYTFIKETYVSYKKPISNRDIDFFLKKEFMRLTGISERDWLFENDTQNKVLRVYSKWLISKLSQKGNDVEITNSMLLFTKIFNYYPVFTIEFTNRSLIFLSTFLRGINSYFQNGELLYLFPPIEKTRKILGRILYREEFIHSPLTDRADYDFYSPGYLIKRNELDERVRKAKIFSQSFLESSFVDIFLIVNLCELRFRWTIVNRLNEKIDLGYYPKESELMDINSLKGDSDFIRIRNEFFARFYLFEYIEL